MKQIVVRLLALGSLAAAGAGPALAQAPAAAPPSAPPQPPRCDNACVRTNADRAVPACAPRIEAEAPGDYDWLFRPYGGIFQEADTPEQPTSAVVRYRGDSIRFLSPQKEWVRAVYECGYDAASQQVAYVRVRLGVLGKASAVPVLPPPQRPGPGASAAPVRPGAAGPAARPAPGPASPAAQSASAVNLRRIGEPSDVDVRQIPAGAKPPAVPAAPNGQPVPTPQTGP